MSVNFFQNIFKSKRAKIFFVSIVSYIIHEVINFFEPKLCEMFFVKWFFLICVYIPFPIFMFLRYRDTTLSEKKRYNSMFLCCISMFLLVATFIFYFYKNYFDVQ